MLLIPKPYLKNSAFSPSDASGNPSNWLHTVTRWLSAKNLPLRPSIPALTPIPTFKNASTVKRAFGDGLSNFLNKGKMLVGMFPLEDAVGTVWGGWVVAGGAIERLKTVCRRIPRAYASPTPGGKSRSTPHPDFWTSGELMSISRRKWLP